MNLDGVSTSVNNSISGAVKDLNKCRLKEMMEWQIKIVLNFDDNARENIKTRHILNRDQ